MPEYVPPRIERRDVETFARDGAVCVRGLLDDAWVDRMRQAIDRVESIPGPFRERYSPDDPGAFLSDKFLWTLDSDFRAAALDSQAAEAACRLMRASRVNVFYDHLMVKEPGAVSRTPWHQDLNYWPVEGEQVCSVWIAFDHIDRSNGAMEFVAGGRTCVAGASGSIEDRGGLRIFCHGLSSRSRDDDACRNGQVVQRNQGIRLHRTGRRLQGRVCPHIRCRAGRTDYPSRGAEDHL